VPAATTLAAVGEFLRCSMGLSAWKQYGTSRWALRVNPSSGNLHPTETYVVWNGRVCHYAPKEHALEVRCESGLPPPSSLPPSLLPPDSLLVALSSIHWREAWKYGERAFRYCQHDVGHAIGALRVAASLLGWRVRLLPRWSDDQIATLLGLDRAADYEDAEREDPDCLAVVTPGDLRPWCDRDPRPLVDAAARATWHGFANRLSSNRIEWPIIDEVAHATRYGGAGAGESESDPPEFEAGSPVSVLPYAREILLQRRSATAFDPRYALRRDTFLSMLARLQPDAPPWDVMDWPASVHLLLFVHRVDGVTPGIYVYLRDPAVLEEWKGAMRSEFLWEQAQADAPLYLLVPIDARRTANRVSCDQDIAEDGFFSLGMIARLEAPLRERGAWCYRRLFWECGVIGQLLYLEAEAAGARATGIGCFYDDPVHELLGLTGHAWQSLYHTAVGMPVEDPRLTTEPGYEWEADSVSGLRSSGSGHD
jgi:SagB-type dehydrogenase family enzyme